MIEGKERERGREREWRCRVRCSFPSITPSRQVHNKFFLTVGDWTVKVWAEDQRTPLMTTPCAAAPVAAAAWSQSRPGVFFAARADGCLDVWDYYHRQTEPALMHKVRVFSALPN